MAITAHEYFNAIGNGGGGSSAHGRTAGGNQYNWLADQMMSHQDQMSQAAAHNEYLQGLQNKNAGTTAAIKHAATSLLLLLEE